MSIMKPHCVSLVNGQKGKERLQRRFMKERKVHDIPEHNGVIKRPNQTILEKVRTMLHESVRPK